MLVKIALAWAALASASGPQWHTRFEDASAAARKEGKPVLADFQAPWCYSCYFMEGHVLNGPRFASLAKGLILLKLDVDKPEGAALKERYRVSFLPTFLLLGPKGEELGRVIGEQTEQGFVGQLSGLLRPPAGGPEDRAIAALRARLAARDFASARADLAALPGDVSLVLGRQPEWRALKARLSLMEALQGRATAAPSAVVAPLNVLLAEDRSCDLAYDVVFSEPARDKLAPEAKEPLLRAQAKALKELADESLFTGQCADFRTGLEALAETYRQLGRMSDRERLLRRAVSFLRAKARKAGDDRNRDDNLRYFLELSEDDSGLRAFFLELVEAYPADYVYSYRYAKYLHARGEQEEALRRAEKADQLCYGANRLDVTLLRAKILKALGRGKEARAFLARDIKAYGKSFSAKARALEELLAGIPE